MELYIFQNSLLCGEFFQTPCIGYNTKQYLLCTYPYLIYHFCCLILSYPVPFSCLISLGDKVNRCYTQSVNFFSLLLTLNILLSDNICLAPLCKLSEWFPGLNYKVLSSLKPISYQNINIGIETYHTTSSRFAQVPFLLLSAHPDPDRLTA